MTAAARPPKASHAASAGWRASAARTAPLAISPATPRRAWCRSHGQDGQARRRSGGDQVAEDELPSAASTASRRGRRRRRRWRRLRPARLCAATADGPGEGGGGARAGHQVGPGRPPDERPRHRQQPERHVRSPSAAVSSSREGRIMTAPRGGAGRGAGAATGRARCRVRCRCPSAAPGCRGLAAQRGSHSRSSRHSRSVRRSVANAVPAGGSSRRVSTTIRG